MDAVLDWALEALARLAHSVVHRPYAFALFAVYAALATWHLGVARVWRMTVAGYAIAWASELSSIHNGFPYGKYAYLHDALADDLLVCGVPFFDSLSYVFLAYFSWATALILLGGLRPDLGLVADPAPRRSKRVLVLAAFLMTWLDVVVDPISNHGDRWFLGKIYEYEEPGAHFGVPLSNYAGWLLVAFLIVLAYQKIDAAYARRPARCALDLPKQGLYAPAAYFAVVAFALVMTFWIGEPGMGLAGAVLMLPLAVAVVLRARRRVAPDARTHTASK